jgi:hypothetical protein
MLHAMNSSALDTFRAFRNSLYWRAYIRRFDLEHTFRFLKQTLGWTTPRVRHPEQDDRGRRGWW